MTTADAYAGGVSTQSRPAARRHELRRAEAGLLLLRIGTGVSLFALFGITKFGWLVALVRSHDRWNEWGFARQIGALGFPAPVLFAVCAVINETVTPMLIAAGLFTRVAATFGALGFAGALYTSIRLGEEPLRAATYLVAFTTLALTGGGRYSLDHVRST